MCITALLGPETLLHSHATTLCLQATDKEVGDGIRSGNSCDDRACAAVGADFGPEPLQFSDDPDDGVKALGLLERQAKASRPSSTVDKKNVLLPVDPIFRKPFSIECFVCFEPQELQKTRFLEIYKMPFQALKSDHKEGFHLYDSLLSEATLFVVIDFFRVCSVV